MYIGMNNYQNYHPEICDGHSCPRDCEICPWWQEFLNDLREEKREKEGEKNRPNDIWL